MLSLVIFCGKLLNYQRATDLKSLPHQSHQFFFPEFPGKKYRKPVYIGYTYQGYPRLPKDETMFFFGVKPWTSISDSRMTASGTSRSLGFLWAGTEWRHHQFVNGFFHGEWYVGGVSPAFFWDFPTRERGILPHPQVPISTPPTPGRVKLFVFDLNPAWWFFETTKGL